MIYDTNSSMTRRVAATVNPETNESGSPNDGDGAHDNAP